MTSYNTIISKTKQDANSCLLEALLLAIYDFLSALKNKVSKTT